MQSLDTEITLYATYIMSAAPDSCQWHETEHLAREFVRLYNIMVEGKHASQAEYDGPRVVPARSLLGKKICVGGAPLPDYIA